MILRPILDETQQLGIIQYANALKKVTTFAYSFSHYHIQTYSTTTTTLIEEKNDSDLEIPFTLSIAKYYLTNHNYNVHVK